MNRLIMQQALDALRRVGEYGDIYRHKNTEQSPYTQIYEAIDAINVELAKPEPIYVMGNYVGEGKVVSASFGLPKGAFEFAPHTGAGEASKIKHSIEPEQEPVAKHVCNLWINPKTSEYEVDRCTHPISEVIPVYISPPRKEWVGLTQEERHAYTQSPFTEENYRAIEAKLRSKNGAT
jgi:hypothetical protein